MNKIIRSLLMAIVLVAVFGAELVYAACGNNAQGRQHVSSQNGTKVYCCPVKNKDIHVTRCGNCGCPATDHNNS